MKVVGEKSELLILPVFGCIILIGLNVPLSVVIFREGSPEAIFMLVVVYILTAFVMARVTFLVFFIPQDIVLFDEDFYIWKVYLTKSKVITIRNDDIEHIEMVHPTRAAYCELHIRTKNGEEYKATAISRDNTVTDTLLRIGQNHTESKTTDAE